MSIFKKDAAPELETHLVGRPEIGGIQFEFVSKGESFKSVPKGVIVVDVGGKFGNGIYDHHQEEKDSASKFIFERLAEVEAYIQQTLVTKIILHETPDIDAIVSAFMVFTMAKGIKITEKFENVVNYANFVDINGIHPGVEDVDNFSGYVAGLYAKYPKKKEEHYVRVVDEAFALLGVALKNGAQFYKLHARGFPLAMKISDMEAAGDDKKVKGRAMDFIKRQKKVVDKFKDYEVDYFKEFVEELTIQGEKVRYLAIDLHKETIEKRAEEDEKDFETLLGFSFTYPFIAYGEDIPIVLLKSGYPDGSLKFVLGLDNNSHAVKSLNLNVVKATELLGGMKGIKWKKINDFLVLSEKGIDDNVTLQNVSAVVKSAF